MLYSNVRIPGLIAFSLSSNIWQTPAHSIETLDRHVDEETIEVK